jgi:hypothetical protein
MSDDRFEQFLRREAGRYHAPPAVPREKMWRAIADGRRVERRRTRPPTWIYWGAGIAAALVIGVGIGRFTVPGEEAATVADAGSAETAGPSATQVAFRLTAAQHLARVEVFLIGFRSDARSGAPGAGSVPDARSLLATTRVLIDSPAAEDVMLRQLLEDIELVLSQIASYAGGSDSTELDFIDESLDQRSVLFRLRTATDAGPVGTLIQGVL